MTSQTLPIPQLDWLRFQVEAAIRLRWVRPQPPERRYRTPAERVDQTAKAVLDAMLTRPFRIRKLPSNEEYTELLARVRHWVQKGQSVRITLGYAPMKNLNSCRISRADWSEFFALTHLCTWHNKVHAVYPPGLRIKIVFDDSTVSMANRPDRRHMDHYIGSIDRLIDALGYRSFLVGTMRQSSFAWLFNFGFYQVARWRVQRWERDPANQNVVEQMTMFARRNLLLPPGLDEAAQLRAYREASHRYRVYWEALQLSGVSKNGKNLIAMYLDGHQHHIKQPSALHLATLGKEQVTQPWQGEGALRDNGKGKLVAFVLTAGRRSKLVAQTIDGLDLVPLEGFDTIKVCAETVDAAAAPPNRAAADGRA